jgi:hypothetical protein
MYRILEKQEELNEHLLPVLKRNGSEIPKDGCYVAAVEFDERGRVIAYQMVQNALFMEGLWAEENTGAHLLALYRIAAQYAKERLGADRIMTMTRCDDTGNRIGRIAQKLGFEKLNWNIFRRKA